MNRFLLVTALALLAAPLSAASLEWDGVLGNSGAQDADLVRFAPQEARGMGVALDRFGSLWDRAGRGRLNRYAADGRLLAQHPLPDRADRYDQLALVDDVLVLLVGDELLTLPVTAAAGSAPASVRRDVRLLSPGSAAGKVAIVLDKEVLLFDPASGTTAPTVALPSRPEAVELAPDGALYLLLDWKLRRFVDGREDTAGWPRSAPGERPQRIGDAWFGSSWHSTIKRFDAAGEPAPGVVYGGASGSFIGHLDANAELINGRGLAQLRGDLFAASGFNGVLQLLVWDGAARQFSAVRRISAVPACGGLGLDRAGNVYHFNGTWAWNDRPDTPQSNGVNPPGFLAQGVMLDSDQMVAPASLWGKPGFYHGKLTAEVACQRIDNGCALSDKTVGAAALRDAQGATTLVTIDRAGAAQAFRIDGTTGAWQADLGAVAIATATPVAAWTSLAAKDRDTLLAAGDGAVLELARDGAGWRERRRWSSWGTAPDQRFGAAITIAADGGTLAVSDQLRHRVLLFPLAAQGAPRAALGTVDTAGDGRGTFAAPGAIAIRGQRVVVFDGGNQRLVKLRVVE